MERSDFDMLFQQGSPLAYKFLQSLSRTLVGQMRRADQAGARLALVLGADELASGQVSVKFLRDEREQQTVALERAVEMMRAAAPA